MTDYKITYTKLLNTLNDIIDRLENVQKETELIYMNSRDLESIRLELEEGREGID